jgi:hypothetical protein
MKLDPPIRHLTDRAPSCNLKPVAQIIIYILYFWGFGRTKSGQHETYGARPTLNYQEPVYGLDRSVLLITANSIQP